MAFLNFFKNQSDLQLLMFSTPVVGVLVFALVLGYGTLYSGILEPNALGTMLCQGLN